MESLFFTWPTLIVLGIGLRMALRLHYGARGAEAADPVYEFLSITAWVLVMLGFTPAVVVGALSIFGMILGFTSGPIGGVISVFGLIVVGFWVAILVEIVTLNRAAQRRSTGALLALTLQHRQQLEPSVLLAGRLTNGFVGRASARLFHRLNAGEPLMEAVRGNPRAVPSETIAYLSAGHSGETKMAALRELCRTDRSQYVAVWRECIERITYLSCVLSAMMLVLTFIMIKIAPSFARSSPNSA